MTGWGSRPPLKLRGMVQSLQELALHCRDKQKTAQMTDLCHTMLTHTLNDENLTLYSDEAYTGAAAVAPKAGKSSSTSRGFWLFIVFTVKEAEINTLKLADKYA